jgi:tripartite ATP-independent transporter DctP family solute receptor
MNRRELLRGTFAASIALSTRPAGAVTPAVLTATDVHPGNYPTVEAVRWLGAQLAQRSQGALSLRLYHSGQLGRESDAIELARLGAIDLTRVYTGALNNACPATRALCLPNVFTSVAHQRRVLDGAVGREVLQGFAARGLVGLALYDSGARCIYNTRHPVVVPGDLHGLKLRVPPSDIFMQLLRDFGANPTPLPYGEVFSALETRLIDGAENNLRSFHASRHFERARYWSQSAHSYAPDVLVVSQRRFDALEPAQREWLRELASASVEVMRRHWDEGEAVARTALEAAGVQFNPVDAAAFARAAAPLLRRHRDDPQVARLLDAIAREADA